MASSSSVSYTHLDVYKRQVSKTLSSAIANAENNLDLDANSLFVAQIFADEGTRMKRVKAGARGRYKPRVKRISHLTVVLGQRENK